MRRILISAIIIVLVSFQLAMMIQVEAQPQRKAVVLSSLNQVAPLGSYGAWFKYELAYAGYQVTFLNDKAVTLDFLVTQLNNYDVVIWRTNIYTYRHVTYWYVGETVNSAALNKYAADFAKGWLNGNAGVLGINVDFMNEHFLSGSLTNVKLMVLVSSNSITIANYFINAGAKAVVSCNGIISLAFGLIDDQTAALLSYLARGDTVLDAVYNTIAPFSRITVRDPLDSYYPPPFWFSGDGTVKLR